MPIVLIPAYQPDEPLVTLVSQLSALSIPCIVVNDGSDASKEALFEKIQKLNGVHVLHHKENQGKGNALKTGFRYYLDNYPSDLEGIVTADADGQHLVSDITSVCVELLQKPDNLILGVRNIEASHVPLRSRFGNVMTKYFFRLVTGKNIVDTQTGLRGIPRELLPSLLNLASEHYEFELEMLLFASKQNIPIHQITIQTVYENNNASSHFRVVVDSMRIYFVLFRFVSISLLSFLIDYGLFTLCFLVSNLLLPSLAIARITSSTVNFVLNKKFAFQYAGHFWQSLIQYYVLCFMVFALSLYIIKLFLFLKINVFIAKILADALIFFFSFSMQKFYIFAKREREPSS
jgi:glycosyltransferase involved in cell wall biosynthesis